MKANKATFIFGC